MHSLSRVRPLLLVLCALMFLWAAPPRARAAEPAAETRLVNLDGINLLPFDAGQIVSIGNQTGEGWFLTGEMLELIHSGAGNIVCTQPFACLPNHVVGKGVIKELRRLHPS